MKVKNVKLEYWVFYQDFNSRNFKKVNILDGMTETIAKQIRSHKITSWQELYDWLRKEFMYHYWSKCEYEYALGSMWVKDVEELEKKDVWFQIKDNVTMITDYIIAKMEIKFGGENDDSTN